MRGSADACASALDCGPAGSDAGGKAEVAAALEGVRGAENWAADGPLWGTASVLQVTGKAAGAKMGAWCIARRRSRHLSSKRAGFPKLTRLAACLQMHTNYIRKLYHCEHKNLSALLQPGCVSAAPVI